MSEPRPGTASVGSSTNSLIHHPKAVTAAERHFIVAAHKPSTRPKGMCLVAETPTTSSVQVSTFKNITHIQEV